MRDAVRIAVVPASGSAGASFVSGLIAGMLTEKTKKQVTLAELGHPYFYDALFLEQVFALKSFTPYRELLRNGSSVRELSNRHLGINWAVLRRGDDAAPPQELFRFIYNVPGDYIVMDCSGLDSEAMINVLADSDRKIIIIDPLPTKLIGSFPFLGELRLKFPDAVYVANKMNRAVHKPEFAKMIGTKNYIPLPAVSAEAVYSAEYGKMLPGSIREVRQAMAEGLARLENAIFS